MDFEDESFLQLQKAMKEIKMWRQLHIDTMGFLSHETEERKYFTEMLMNRGPGIEDIHEYEEFMLKGYRDTREKND